MFEIKNDCLYCRFGYESVVLRGWGQDGIRFQGSVSGSLTLKYDALREVVTPQVRIEIADKCATLTNGALSVEITDAGHVSFYKNGALILNEKYRHFGYDTPHTPSLKLYAREYKPIVGDSYKITQRFEGQAEKIFGMGQYQDGLYDLKGSSLELAQRNSQITVPFYISSLGYGFLWNNPSVGRADFATNETTFVAACSTAIDYYVVAGTPKEIEERYTETVGRTPIMDENVFGLWQSKLRYRTQDEVLEVAREYKRRGVKIDVLVIDFFHWTYQGDWKFDPKYWYDVKGMVRELKSYGIRTMVSIWPTVDKRSENFRQLVENGLGVRVERGYPICFDFLGDTVIYDATNPEARAFIWDKCKQNYFEDGIDMFWLDEAEPEFVRYDFDHYRYAAGHDLEVGNIYPVLHAKAFYDGQTAMGQKDVCNLVRSAWLGSQNYGVLVWSGDIYGNFQSLRDQYYAGLNISLAGIPWWTTDTGGFFVDASKPEYKELLYRWFEYSVFCPVLRMHGDKGGEFEIPPLDERDFGSGFAHTGHPNEIYSFGEDVFSVLRRYVELRQSMKGYIKKLAEDAAMRGEPIMRTMFYEFPDDAECWQVSDQYMFGDKYLVAPVLYEGQRTKKVYLPKAKWQNIFTKQIYDGGKTIEVDAPLDIIPVFEKV
ncbi:MAG: family 31 glucosidase [Clostridiales bacterium]|nr:family 31 glucosidase [Clostridiales bacterium]